MKGALDESISEPDLERKGNARGPVMTTQLTGGTKVTKAKEVFEQSVLVGLQDAARDSQATRY
jgi:hypothetical protein